MRIDYAMGETGFITSSDKESKISFSLLGGVGYITIIKGTNGAGLYLASKIFARYSLDDKEYTATPHYVVSEHKPSFKEIDTLFKVTLGRGYSGEETEEVFVYTDEVLTGYMAYTDYGDSIKIHFLLSLSGAGSDLLHLLDSSKLTYLTSVKSSAEFYEKNGFTYDANTDEMIR